MGCSSSKCIFRSRKNKKKKCEAKAACSSHDGSGKFSLEQQGSALDVLLDTYEKQLKVLDGIAALSEGQERERILKEHQNEELFRLICSIVEKVKTETSTEIRVCHDQQIEILTTQHHKQTEDLQRLHSDTINSLEKAHTATENALKGQIEELTAELKKFTDLKQRVSESTWKKDLQRNIETHGSPGEFWEQEHESLLMVIEMKSERLQEHQQKLLRLEELDQINLTLENQVHLVQRQNEDLKHKLDNQQVLICQLYSEQKELQDVLEKQTLQAQKLSHEKDILQYKLHNGQDSCAQASHRSALGVPQMT